MHDGSTHVPGSMVRCTRCNGVLPLCKLRKVTGENIQVINGCTFGAFALYYCPTDSCAHHHPSPMLWDRCDGVPPIVFRAVAEIV